MEIIPVKTRTLQPPQDDLLRVLEEALPPLCEQDILVISSKVVSIDEGNCVSAKENDKHALAVEQADLLIPRDYWPTPLTIKHNAFIGTSGIDASNANEHFILLPKDPFASAKRLAESLMRLYGLDKFAVIISDSHSTPLRRGAIGISIGYYGLNPTLDLVGTEDLFGREFKAEVANIVDGIAAGANIAMGEGNESQPAAIVRGVSSVEFTTHSYRDFHMVSHREDTFRVLYDRFLEN